MQILYKCGNEIFDNEKEAINFENKLLHDIVAGINWYKDYRLPKVYRAYMDAKLKLSRPPALRKAAAVKQYIQDLQAFCLAKTKYAKDIAEYKELRQELKELHT